MNPMDKNGNASCLAEKKRQSHLYEDKVILAPMVRENSLAFRLLCLKYNADLVYTEELIDYRLSECRRLENKVLATIDFVDERGEVLFRTCEEERDRVILQLGSNNPDRALKAARLVANDVLGIDFNFGCPKSFSLSGGMGAALLDKPDQIEALLRKCIENLEIPVTCKMRILPNLDSTLNLVKLIESCGVSAIAVHGRTKDQRPRHDNQDNILKEIAKVISIPMIANGASNHIKSYSDILKYKESVGASSVMIARIAMKNPSIFRPDNVMDPINTVIKEFIKLAVKYDNYVAVTKYAIQSMLSSGHYGGDFVQKLHSACDLKTICDLFDLNDWFQANRVSQDKSKFYDSDDSFDAELEKFITDKMKELELDNHKLVIDTVPYLQQLYGPITPKSQLMDYMSKKHVESKPKYFIVPYKQHRYYCIIEYNGEAYMNRTFTNSKKQAEQATSLLICDRMNIIDLTDYKARTSGSSRNIH